MKKYYGKEKCRILKEIRAAIAEANDIEWVVSECTHKGDCRGTCPRCEAEVRALEDALVHRRAIGKRVAVVGISAGIALSVTGCEDLFAIGGKERIDGEYPAYEETEAPTERDAETETDAVLGGKPMELPERETETLPETVPASDSDH